MECCQLINYFIEDGRFMNIKEIINIIKQGEGYKIEFKEKIDKTFVEEVVAFANASGGRILIGIEDDGRIKGVDTSNLARSRIQDAIVKIKPILIVNIQVVENIIVIDVPEGVNKPYACSKGFYLRMGANSQKLERDGIIEFFQNEGKIRFDEILRPEIDFKNNFDVKAYQEFIILSDISNVINYQDVLVNLDCGVLKNQFIFNNAGILFFSKNPMKYIKHATVVCALYKGVDKTVILDKKDLSGNLIEIIEDSIVFLKKHLNIRFEIKGMRREEILDIPEVALREAVVNAICHRDYFEKGAQVMIEIFDDRVVISNPGGLPKGLNRKNFGKVSMARNPVIASLLQRSDYIEKMGTGITRMRNTMSIAKLPDPEFEMDGFFIVSLKRESYLNIYNVGEDVGENVGDDIMKLSPLQLKIIKLIKESPKLSAIKIAEKLNVNSRTIERNIRQLKELNIIERIGHDYGGYWKVKDKS